MPALLALLLSCAAATVAFGQPAADQPSGEVEEPSRLIQQLADPDPLLREAATSRLWALGEPAAELLKAATDGPHPERARRARLVLECIRLGVDPQRSPEWLPNLVVQARFHQDPAERAQARARLAALAQETAPAVARLIRDAALARTGTAPQEFADPPDLVLLDLWPVEPWGQTRVIDELVRMGENQALLDWLELLAAEGRSAVTAANYAFAEKQLGNLPEAIERWRARVEEEDSPNHRSVLLCLLFASSWPDAAGMLGPGGHQVAEQRGASAALLPVAWALLDGAEPGSGPAAGAAAREWAARHPDPLIGLTVELLLAQVADDPGREAAAATAIKQWLEEHAAEPESLQRPTSTRAVVAAMLAGEIESAFSLAQHSDAPGLVRLLYRRMEFDSASMLVVRVSQVGGARQPQAQAVQLTQREMLDELRAQRRRGRSSAELSTFARRRTAAIDAVHAGDAARALELFEQLSRADQSDPALRWSLGQAQMASGDEAAGRAQIQRALDSPLANVWVRRGLAEEMWLTGQREAALEQLHTTARWGTLLPVEALPALELYADSLADAGHHVEAAHVLSATMVLLMMDEVYGQLGDRGLYFTAFMASQIERSRMNRAAEAGDWGRAEAALRRSLAMLPQSEAAIDFVRAADAAGQKPLADRIFTECYGRLTGALGRYSQSPLLNNQAAWFAASCQRRLDSALNYALAAANLDPTSPAALDTLAEVYLRNGELQRAMELLERILALAEARDLSTGAGYGQLNAYLGRRIELQEQAREE